MAGRGELLQSYSLIVSSCCYFRTLVLSEKLNLQVVLLKEYKIKERALIKANVFVGHFDVAFIRCSASLLVLETKNLDLGLDSNREF